MLELVRYIHLNPLRAGLVKDLRELGRFSYSGHTVLVGRKKSAWQDRDYVLGYFGKTEGDAKRKCVEFVAKGIAEGHRPELSGGGLLRTVGGWKGLKELRDSGEKVRADERILGGSDFVERVLRESAEEWERKSVLRQRGRSLSELLEKIARRFGVDAEDLKSGNRSRTVAKARSVLCYLGVRRLGLTSIRLSKELGIGPSALSKAIARGMREVRPDDIELAKSQ